jgi:hypothetical protein
MATKSTFLTVHVCVPGNRSADREYLEELEAAVFSLARRWRSVKRGSSSADSETSEAFGLVVTRAELVEEVGEALIAAIRQVGLRKHYDIHLTKREDGHSTTLVRKVYARRNSRWVLQNTRDSHPAPLPDSDFPERIQDLAAWMNRFYLAGGSDAYDVFESNEDLKAFLASLSDADACGLREAYQTIVRRHDQRFVMDWITEDNDAGLKAKDRAAYFLAFLDRLCQGGLLAGQSQKCVGLVDWGRVV